MSDPNDILVKFGSIPDTGAYVYKLEQENQQLRRDLALERAAKYAAESRAIEQHGKRMEEIGAIQEVLLRVCKQLLLTHGLEVIGGGAPDDSGRIDNSMQIAEINAVVQGETQERKWKLMLSDKIIEKDTRISNLLEALRRIQPLVDTSMQFGIPLENREIIRKIIQKALADPAVQPIVEKIQREAHRFCHICNNPTDLACADCQIDFQTTIYVCKKASCRNEHERKCSAKLRKRLVEKDAHVYRLRDALTELYAAVKRESPSLLYEDSGDSKKLDHEIGSILNSTPIQSLAEHDAEVARKAIADATQEVYFVFGTIGGAQGQLEYLVFEVAQDAERKCIKFDNMTLRDDGLYEIAIQVVRGAIQQRESAK